MKFYYTYILECSEKSYYTGMTNDLKSRFAQHQSGKNKECFTYRRRPLKFVWHIKCTNPTEAIKIEKQIKGCSRRKKKVLIEENWQDLVAFSRNYTQFGKDESSTSSDFQEYSFNLKLTMVFDRLRPTKRNKLNCDVTVSLSKR